MYMYSSYVRVSEWVSVCDGMESRLVSNTNSDGMRWHAVMWCDMGWYKACRWLHCSSLHFKYRAIKRDRTRTVVLHTIMSSAEGVAVPSSAASPATLPSTPLLAPFLLLSSPSLSPSPLDLMSLEDPSCPCPCEGADTRAGAADEEAVSCTMTDPLSASTSTLPLPILKSLATFRSGDGVDASTVTLRSLSLWFLGAPLPAFFKSGNSLLAMFFAICFSLAWYAALATFSLLSSMASDGLSGASCCTCVSDWLIDLVRHWWCDEVCRAARCCDTKRWEEKRTGSHTKTNYIHFDINWDGQKTLCLE